MAIYGDDCNGSSFNLLLNNQYYGTYTAPIEITEEYLGEPFTNGFFYEGTVGGRSAYRIQLFDAQNNLVLNELYDRQNYYLLEPPANEYAQWLWRIYWHSNWGIFTWSGSQWVNVAPQYYDRYFRFPRYTYTITQL